MGQYLSPGVYVIETSGGVKPIQGVGTSTGAFVGIAEKGVLNKAVLVTNWTQFVTEFGEFIDGAYLAYCVYNFFAEGGTACYVVRAGNNAKTANCTIKSAPLITIPDVVSNVVLNVWACSRGDTADPIIDAEDIQLKISDSQGNPDNFNLDVDYTPVEIFENRTTFGKAVGNNLCPNSKYIQVYVMTPETKPKLSKGTESKLELSGKKPLQIEADGNGNTISLKIVPRSPDPSSDKEISITIDPASNGDDECFKITVTYLPQKEIFPNLTVNNKSQRDDLDLKSACIKVGVNKPNARPLSGSYNFTDSISMSEVLTIDALAEDEFGDGSKGTWGNRIAVSIEDGADKKASHFNLKVLFDQRTEVFYNQTTEGTTQDLFIKSNYVKVSVSIDNYLPKNGTYFLKDGNNGSQDVDYIGDEVNKNGVHAFDEINNINIVAIPDLKGNRDAILKALNYCENRKNKCFFIADPPQNVSPSDVMTFKDGTGKYNGAALNSSFGALYYPWVTISDPKSGQRKSVPPSGAAAGTYSYTDAARGVHKAPAGITEGHVDSAVGLERIVTKGENDQLYPALINVIRSLSAGICIWGARTLSQDTEFQYINVRRLLLYIEDSIEQGTQWVVFEPNDSKLWGTVKRNITAFLTNIWRDGALVGATPEQAFFVKVDSDNNPEDLVNKGELHIDVGVAPVKPAEFVVIQISQKTIGK